MNIHGEDILDEAATFSKRALCGSENLFPYAGNDINDMSSLTLRELVKNTLSNPFHKSLPRFDSGSSQVYLGGPYEWMEAFRELAMLDLDTVASINRGEILQVTK